MTVGPQTLTAARSRHALRGPPRATSVLISVQLAVIEQTAPGREPGNLHRPEVRALPTRARTPPSERQPSRSCPRTWHKVHSSYTARCDESDPASGGGWRRSPDSFRHARWDLDLS